MSAPDTVPDGVRAAAGDDAVAAAATVLFGSRVGERPELLQLVADALDASDGVRKAAVFPVSWYVTPGVGDELVVMRDTPAGPEFVISRSLAGWRLWPVLDRALPHRDRARARVMDVTEPLPVLDLSATRVLPIDVAGEGR